MKGGGGLFTLSGRARMLVGGFSLGWCIQETNHLPDVHHLLCCAADSFRIFAYE